eukprot:m.113810 g.113810  ORF g.113810 m.113810 type:complete len:125 (-) comp51877_c0_seq3:222-596(-)
MQHPLAQLSRNALGQLCQLTIELDLSQPWDSDQVKLLEYARSRYVTSPSFRWDERSSKFEKNVHNALQRAIRSKALSFTGQLRRHYQVGCYCGESREFVLFILAYFLRCLDATKSILRFPTKRS